MPQFLVAFTPEAENEALHAFFWYENQRVACKRTRPNRYRQIKYFDKLKIFYQYGYNRQF